MTKVKESKSTYWNQRYLDKNTGWDIGRANAVLVNYVLANFPKHTKILIPGAGNGHEASHLIRSGYDKCYALDFSQKAKQNFIEQNEDISPAHYIVDDFFDLKGTYDLIIEQTFFCAIHPSRRLEYVDQASLLLSKYGKIAGLLFEMEKEDGPPYGGTGSDYENLFSKKFTINSLEITNESISTRLGKELFFEFSKK